MKIYRTKTKCVLCDAQNLTRLTNFPDTPLANQLFSPSDLPKGGQIFVPLNLCLCNDCKHIQIDTLVDPSILFADYPYVSNSSEAMALRLNGVADKYIKRFGLDSSDLVLEIGSNDGYLLSKFMAHGCSVLGIDPAVNATNIAIQKGVPSIVDFFSEDIGKKILDENQKPRIIIANNVLAHSDSLQDIFSGISLLMSNATTTIIEFSYVVDVFEKLLFDTIYHEHTSYHSIFSLVDFLKKFGLEIFDVERFDAHGGSARVFIKKRTGKQEVEKSVTSALEYEAQIRINEVDSWENFNSRITMLANVLNTEISRMRADGQSLIGYGVPAKFTSLFHILGLNETDFDYIVDDNPLKIGKIAPGTKIVISKTEEVSGSQNAIIFSWNYSSSITEKIIQTNLVTKQLLIPLPEFQVISLS